MPLTANYVPAGFTAQTILIVEIDGKYACEMGDMTLAYFVNRVEAYQAKGQDYRVKVTVELVCDTCNRVHAESDEHWDGVDI